MRHLTFITLTWLTLLSCSSKESSHQHRQQLSRQKGELISRRHNEQQFALVLPQRKQAEIYPWRHHSSSPYPRITKEHFRCKGCSSHPISVEYRDSKTPVHHADCAGGLVHSLPLRDNHESIYPILIDLLNLIQDKTGHQVIITCGHRCPVHNEYADFSPLNRTSKHMIGAEVDFYVQGMEDQPQAIVDLIISTYANDPQYYHDLSWSQFQRYLKEDTNVSTLPWYNKEIFIKLFHQDEGRDFDNHHSYPYISIQVRYDKERQERVFYSWEKASRGYLQG